MIYVGLRPDPQDLNGSERIKKFYKIIRKLYARDYKGDTDLIVQANLDTFPIKDVSKAIFFDGIVPIVADLLKDGDKLEVYDSIGVGSIPVVLLKHQGKLQNLDKILDRQKYPNIFRRYGYKS